MINARKELLDHLNGRKVKFVSIVWEKNDDTNIVIKGTLDEVMSELDFDYDNSYGRQEVFGYIWYINGYWSDRGEYDGSEWWQYQKRPNLPTMPS